MKARRVQISLPKERSILVKFWLGIPLNEKLHYELNYIAKDSTQEKIITNENREKNSVHMCSAPCKTKCFFSFCHLISLLRTYSEFTPIFLGKSAASSHHSDGDLICL